MLADPMPFIPRDPAFDGLRAIWAKYGSQSSRPVAGARKPDGATGRVLGHPDAKDGDTGRFCESGSVAKRHTGDPS